MSKPHLRLGFERFSGLYLWAIIIVVFAIWTPQFFLTLGTLHSVASEESTVAMLAIGLCVPFAAGAYDLSIGATINLSAVIVAVLQTQDGWGMWEAIIAAVLISALIGVINGFIVVRLGVSSFITTLGSASIILAVQEIITGAGQPLGPTTHAWNDLAQTNVFGFQISVLYMIIFAIIVWWFLEYTPAGRYLYAIGDNPEAARLSGIAVGRWTWLSLIIAATASGIAGVVYSSQSGPSLTFGSALLLPAFAAIFLGSTQLKPGRVNVWGTLLAIFVLATGVKGLELVTGAEWLNDMFDGVALVVAVSFAAYGARRKNKAAVERAMESGRLPPDDNDAAPEPPVEGPGNDQSGVIIQRM
jgi:ribose transport system permease protein